jgi:tetratricopeptide (TPR) repeat protein
MAFRKGSYFFREIIMKKYFFLLVVFLNSYFNASACLNGENYILKNGQILYANYDDGLPFGNEINVNNFDKIKSELDSLYKKTKDVGYLSDIGYILILEKKYKAALEIYLNIEKTNPNRYSTASNLGTLYELLGENKKALEWINKSIKIDPKSHNGSEWLHSKILEAKIKGDKFCTSEFILGLYFGESEYPGMELMKSERYRIYSSIFYQVNERITLINPRDKIIALLLFDLGNLAIINQDYLESQKLFEKSAEYGMESNIFKLRMAYVNGELNNNKTFKKKVAPKIDFFKALSLVLGIILSLILGKIIFQKVKN